ncbi:MAG: DUF3341 domain-containing protein [Planctomycetota bacterium]
MTQLPTEPVEPKVWGLLAEFPDVTSVFDAAHKVREAGFAKWDVHCPFPIHEMDEAMGLKPSQVPNLMGGAAFTGVAVALLMQWWMAKVDYPILIAGKPLFAWEWALPITFELGVLFSAFAAVFGMLALNGLPRPHHPLMSRPEFLKAGDDGFFISIEAKDKNFDPEKTRELLESLGATGVEVVED